MTTISAQVIADSISPFGKRLTTFQLRYPRFIHAEFMTHRMFSRNASSSRAIPVERMIQDIIDDTAMPIHWGKNQPGMQAQDVELPAKLKYRNLMWEETEEEDREAEWLRARDHAIKSARYYHGYGAHKQIVNRLLEPFMHINVLVTATEYANFFALRDHPDAEPHIQKLAQEMKLAMARSTPQLLQPGDWHLPYVTPDDYLAAEAYIQTLNVEPTEKRIVACLTKFSVARCARVSYLTHDGRKTTVDEDLTLFDRLIGSTPMHASPAEHQATPDEAERSRSLGWRYENYDLHGNFVGWIQYRKTLADENFTNVPIEPQIS